MGDYRLSLTSLSMVLHTTEVRLMGLQFPGSCLHSFFCIALALADFQFTGIIPVSAELLNMFVKGAERESSSVRRFPGWRRSGPMHGFVDVKV